MNPNRAGPALSECPIEFNIPTSLMNCNGYRKRMKENTQLYNYLMDQKPGAVCYMPGVNFQGYQGTSNRPMPPDLMAAEDALRRAPLLEEDRDYFLEGDLATARPPQMPKALRTRIIVPECSDILKVQRTKIRFGEFPQYGWKKDYVRTRPINSYNRDMIGIDTRALLKEAWKEREKRASQNSNIYGLSKYDKRALKPMIDIQCHVDTNADCMHVGGPDSMADKGYLDPTMTYQGQLGVGFMPTKKGGQYSQATQRVVADMNGQSQSYMDILANQAKRDFSKIKFYGWPLTN